MSWVSLANIKWSVLTALLCFTAQVLQAQTIRVKGNIFDAETREPISFVAFYTDENEENLVFLSDFEGHFDKEIPDTFTHLTVGFTEYKTVRINRDSIKGKVLTIELKREPIGMQGIEISLKYNPAHRLIKLAQKNKDKLSPTNINHYSCETYTKNIISVNNISEKIKRTKFGQQLGNLFDTISYISGDGKKSILPVFVSEVLSDFYYNKSPKLSKEIIKASRVKGVGVDDGSFISQVLGSTFVNYNFYSNSLVVVDKGVPSPIGDIAMGIYKYKLVHVDRSGPLRVFQIKCTPKQPNDLAFNGYVWIEDSTGALLRLSLAINANANLNFIEKLRITQEYQATEKGYFYGKSRVVIDAQETSTKAMGLVASSSISFQKIDLDAVRPSKFFAERLIMKEDATTHTDAFWEDKRHVQPNDAERRIENSIDTLVNLPSIKTYVDLANFLVDGYVGKGKIGIGPYYNLMSYNQLEGVRLRLGFRTNASFSKNWIIKGMLAYGLKDKEWKYKFLAERILNRKRWTKLGIQYKKDVEQIGITDNDELSNGLFTAFNLLGSNNLNLNRDIKLKFATDIRTGLRVNVSAGNRWYKFQKIGNYNFAWYPIAGNKSIISQEFINSYVKAGFRYTPRFYYLQNENKRVTFVNAGPEYYGNIEFGLRDLFESNFDYTRVRLGFTYRKVWGALGRTRFNTEANAMFGVVPYPLQTVYVGNQSFIYNTSAYNQMRIFEFVSDRSISGTFEHHFNGFLFNRVPLIKKLKWRSIIGSKVIIGTLDSANYDIIPTDYQGVQISTFKALNKEPYVEASFGIENIFKIIRVDAVWRITYREPNNPRNFGVKASIAFGF
mgnify:FL=1|jgi:hypothetical protein